MSDNVVKLSDVDAQVSQKVTRRSKGSKDMRSFRPSTVAELNAAMNYEPYTPNLPHFGPTAILLGNDRLDFCIVSGALLALWSFVLMLFALLLKSALDTDGPSAALWIFFFAFVFFGIGVYFGVYFGQRERRLAEAKEAKEAAAVLEEDKDEPPVVDYSAAMDSGNEPGVEMAVTTTEMEEKL